MFFKRVNVVVFLLGLVLAQSTLAAPAKQYIELYMGQVKTIQVGKIKRIGKGKTMTFRRVLLHLGCVSVA